MAWAESLIAAGRAEAEAEPVVAVGGGEGGAAALRAESDAVRRDAGGTGMGPFAGPGGAFSSGTPEPSRGGTERFDSLDSAFGSPVGLADLLAGAASFGSGSGSDAAAALRRPPDGDDLASSSLASFPLPRAVADDLAARIERLERALRALPTHAGGDGVDREDERVTSPRGAPRLDPRAAQGPLRDPRGGVPAPDAEGARARAQGPGVAARRGARRRLESPRRRARGRGVDGVGGLVVRARRRARGRRGQGARGRVRRDAPDCSRRRGLFFS